MQVINNNWQTLRMNMDLLNCYLELATRLLDTRKRILLT